MSEAEIAVHWKEESKIPPSPKFVSQANLADPIFLEQFDLKNYPKSFDAYAELLTWSRPWEKTLDTSSAPFWKWFVGGKLNASYNCVDRHLSKHPQKPAFIFVPEVEDQSIANV